METTPEEIQARNKRISEARLRCGKYIEGYEHAICGKMTFNSDADYMRGYEDGEKARRDLLHKASSLYGY